MRLTSLYFASLLSLGAHGCAAAEEGGTPPGPVDPTNPVEPGTPPGPDDPQYSVTVRQAPDSLDVVIRTLREVWDVELTTAGGILDVMWYDDARVSEGGYDYYQLTLSLDPLSTLEAMALHDGAFELVAQDALGFDIGTSAIQLRLAAASPLGSWQPGAFQIGPGDGGFLGTLAVTAPSAPGGSVAAFVSADDEAYPVTVEGSGTQYTVRWTQLAMGMCLMSDDCTVHVTANGTVHKLPMAVAATVTSTVGPS